MNIIIGILIPFIGTTLGAMMVFFMKKRLNKTIEKLLYGFASGVMVAASIWSLLIPSIEAAENLGLIRWIPATVGFLVGIFGLIFFDNAISKFEKNKEKHKLFSKNNVMLFFTVTLHNIPEGMAVGVALAGVVAGNVGITIAGALSLAMGIAIQNFPEGAIISMPFKGSGMSKFKAFAFGTLSGIVEPIAAIITLCCTNLIVPVLPYILAFAAGAMVYVVINELLPSNNEDKFKIITIGYAIGFLIMMILDVTLG